MNDFVANIKSVIGWCRLFALLVVEKKPKMKSLTTMSIL